MSSVLSLRAPHVAVFLALALGAATPSLAQVPNAKKELVARVLKAQQSEFESVAHSIVERPAGQILQDVGMALPRSVPPEKREAAGRAAEAEVKKFVDESYPLIRDRSLKTAASTIGPALEEKMSEDELKQLVAWLESPVNKKFQQLGGDLRSAFIGKLLAESQSVIEPKLQALDGRLRSILGVGPAPGPSASAPPASRPPRPAPPAARASGR